MVTFNVIYTPGTAALLLPFTLSLLQSPAIRIRLVANGCEAKDAALLASTAARHERISHVVLPTQAVMEHGAALDHLFSTFPEPHFAIVDSDVIASGDFLPHLLPLVPGQAAVFAASPVWVTDEETVVPPGCSFIGGRQRVLADGTPVGNTYLAIYDRAALEPLWRAAPRGFGTHDRSMLAREAQASLAERGWRYRFFDTSRLLNLQLLLAGYRIENRDVPELHHVGGMSGAGFPWRPETARDSLRAILAILRSGDERRLQRLTDGAAHRLYMIRSRRDPRHRRMNERRGLVLAHVHTALDALLGRVSAPPRLRTDSAAVDRRVAALVAALEAQYAVGLSSRRPEGP